MHYSPRVQWKLDEKIKEWRKAESYNYAIPFFGETRMHAIESPFEYR